MADQLAAPTDLASLLQQDLDASTANLLIECATAVVQEATGGQRILQVAGDTATVIGITDSWLALPQIPVTTVTSVTLDGTTLTVGTDYKVFGDKLWRSLGWQTNWGQNSFWQGYWPPSYWPNGVAVVAEPSSVVVVYTHGHPPGAQDLQLARQATLSLAAGVYANPDGASRVQIDDYAATYEAMSARMETSPNLRAALRRQYGRRAGLVRLG